MKKLAAAAFALVALALITTGGDPPELRSQGEPTAATETHAVARTFRFDYRASTAIDVRGVKDSQTLRGELDLAGEVVVSPLPRSAGEPRRLQVMVGHLDRHSFSFLGRPVLDASSDAAAFFGHASVVVHLDERGFVNAVEEAQEPHPAQHVLEVLATDLPIGFELVESPGEFSQETTRGALTGVASLSSNGRVLTHQVHGYSDIPGVTPEAMRDLKVEGEAVVRFNAEERVETARGSEVINADGYASSVQWKLAAAGSREALALAAPMRETRRPGRAAMRRDTRKQHLVQRVGDMTPKMLLHTLVTFASGGIMPNHNRWLWQASGLVIKNPKLAHDVAALLADPRLNAAARHLIVDVLVAAGHPEAQAALRNALRDNLHRFKAAESVSLVHRTARLSQPDAETIGFVEERFASADDVVSRATAYTLGALAPKATEETKERLLAKIGGMLNEDATSAEIKSALAGLGNAGMADTIELIAPYVNHEEAPLRGQAATALRKINTEQAHELLISMLDDDAVWVQRDVLSAMIHQGASPKMAQAVARRVTSGTLTEPNYADVLNLLKAADSRSKEVVEALAHMSTVPLKRAALRQRIMELHAKLSMNM